MNTTGMRLEIKPWLYQVLVEQQELLRSRTGKKTSLVDILLGFCHKGIKAYKAQKSVRKNVRNLAPNVKKVKNNAENQAKNIDSIQNEEHLAHNSAPNQAQNELMEFVETQLKILEYKEISLINREKWLHKKEQRLLHMENVLNQEKAQNLAQKEVLKGTKNDDEGIKQAIDKLGDELAGTDAYIDNLEEKLLEHESKIDDLLANVKELKENTKEKSGSFIEKIIPFIAPLLSIGGYFLLNKKINDIEPLQEKIVELLKNLDKGGKVDLEDLLEKSKNSTKST